MRNFEKKKLFLTNNFLKLLLNKEKNQITGILNIIFLISFPILKQFVSILGYAEDKQKSSA